jgi:hypothetical protein
MVKWEELTMPRDCGGLGFTNTRLMNECLCFTNTRLMNECLLAKWIIILERGDDDLCCTLLRKKYLKGKGFFSSNVRGASQFSKGLHEMKFTCQRGLKYIVGNGKKIRLWHKV